MIHIALNDEEREVLDDVLANVLSDLRMEISDTDSKDFRETLKGRKAVIEKLLAALRDAAGEEETGE